MRYTYHLLDVFTERPSGGNRLAVFADARGLSHAQMQATARALNLSETVFVFPAAQAGHTRSIRIFTPGFELPFAGHPTIGTAFLLAALGEGARKGDEAALVLEERVGPVRVSVRLRDGQPTFAELTAAHVPERGPEPPPREALAPLLSLEVDDLVADGLSPVALSAGVPFLFIPLRDRRALGRARLDIGRWERDVAGFWAPHVYPLTLDPEHPGSHVRARMFAPSMGITEDPATGAAASALPGLLAGLAPPGDDTLRWVIEQGFEMGRPSILHVAADRRGGVLTAVRVGGSSVLVGGGELEIP
jgi:trans-2,3-dihydro-3-hydroxyanthranilate isomerase